LLFGGICIQRLKVALSFVPGRHERSLGPRFGGSRHDDLNIASTEPLNINDRGEIAGVYLPDGCQNSDLCSHAFVLVPCNNAGVQGCDIMFQPNPAAIAIRAGTTPADVQKTRELTAKWRARLAQRHPVLGIGRSRN